LTREEEEDDVPPQIGVSRMRGNTLYIQAKFIKKNWKKKRWVFF